MTLLDQDLTSLGFSNLSAIEGKVAGLRWIEGGAALYFGLRVEAGLARWEHAKEFRGDGCVDAALAALNSWEISERAKASLNGQAARP